MYSLSPKSHLYWRFPSTSLELSPRSLWGAVCSLLSSFCPSYNWTGNPRVVHLFSVDRGQGMTQWMQVPLECPLPEGSVACIADASTARLRSCLHSLFFPVWFGRSAELSVGPEPPRTNLSLLEGPSSLVKSPLSRYIGLIKGKYFNNMENGRFYSVVGEKKKACSKTACDLILFCKTKPTKHHKNTNTYSKEKGLKYMHQILLLAYWMKVILIFFILLICSTVISTIDMVFS